MLFDAAGAALLATFDVEPREQALRGVRPGDGRAVARR